MSSARPILLASSIVLACGQGLPALVPNSMPLGAAAPAPERRAHSGPLAALAVELARTRGYELEHLPELVELPRHALIASAVEHARRDAPEGALTTAVRALSTLELAPSDLDYFGAIEGAFRQSLQAFYDPERHVIFVDAALASAARESAILHELVHAAQFHSRSAYDPQLDSDQRAALLTLAEGEAAYVTERARRALAPPVMELAPDTSVPAILLRSLAAPYVDGREVVVRAYRAGGWAAVDALWSRMPSSTSELLHPDSAREPAAIGVTAPDERAWQLRSSDVLGEQALRCTLEEWWPDAEARRVASAWSGDRLAWFEAGPEQALIWALQFDSAEHAADAAAALESGMQLDGADVRRTTGERAAALSCRAHRDSGVVGIVSQAEQVWLLALHGLSTEAGCRGLTAWSARLAAGSRGLLPGSAATHRSPPTPDRSGTSARGTWPEREGISAGPAEKLAQMGNGAR